MMSSRKVPMLLSCFPTVQNNTSVKQRQKKWLLRCALMLYSISGWATPLLLDRLRLSEPSIDTTRRGPGVASFHLPNLLPMISNTLGMAVAWLVVSSVAPGGSPLLKRLRRCLLPSSAIKEYVHCVTRKTSCNDINRHICFCPACLSLYQFCIRHSFVLMMLYYIWIHQVLMYFYFRISDFVASDRLFAIVRKCRCFSQTFVQD